MSSFRVIAIPTETAEQVRASGKSPRYGHPAYTETASGHGPCRHCLRTFRVGQENRILFTYDAFSGVEEIPLPGPVFIHEEHCARYAEDAGFPVDLYPYPMLLNAFAKGQTFIAKRFVAGGADKTEAIEGLLRQPEVDYIEVRDHSAGCFDFRIERGS